MIDDTSARQAPFRLTLGDGTVIRGLDIAVTGMRPGEVRQITIPSYLAYGEAGVGNGMIPPNAVLDFKVTVVDPAPVGPADDAASPEDDADSDPDD